MLEEQKIHEGKNEQESSDEALKDTGVLIYHIPTGIRNRIGAKVRRGNGRIYVNGIPINELMEIGRVSKIEELLRVITRERLKGLEIDLDVGDALSSDTFSPSVLAYALAEALTNLLGRL